eukprot:scaffold22052_cov22-Prasinocladus_malaysianus.AAC.1
MRAWCWLLSAGLMSPSILSGSWCRGASTRDSQMDYGGRRNDPTTSRLTPSSRSPVRLIAFESGSTGWKAY